MKKVNVKEAKLKEVRKRNIAKMNAIIYPSETDASHSEGDAYIILRNINKIYDNDVQAVFDFNLNINKNEFIVLVGPSGCGKSTTLRMVCGLEQISSGELFINRVYSNELAPKDRDIALVFQSYALYPHMSVFNNMAFGLKIKKVPTLVKGKDGQPIMWIDKTKLKELRAKRKVLVAVSKESKGDAERFDKEMANLEAMKEKGEVGTTLEKIADRLFVLQEKKEYELERVERATREIEAIDKQIEETLKTPTEKYVMRHMPKAEIEKKVLAAAETLEITEYLNRKPKALSGGQRQRVALGRAIVRNAAAFLMDEPLSNLDAKLRVQMRSEIVKLHRTVGATTIYVTHDQTEAMTMADRIIVMSNGVVQQIGTPRAIYDHPKNLFVATFIGAPAMNILNAEYEKGEIILGETKLALPKEMIESTKAFYEGEITRLNDVSARLDNCLKDEEDKRRDVYLMAKEEIGKIVSIYNNRLNGSFDTLFGIRPEHIGIAKKEDKDAIEVTVDVVELLGSEYFIHTEIAGQDIVLKIPSDMIINTGDKIKVNIDMSRSHMFDEYTNRGIF